MTEPLPARRLVLSAAAVATLLATTSGCVRVRSPRREADPEHYNSYELLNVDGTIVIDTRTPGHPTRDELGFGKSTFGAISHDEPFPVLLKLPSGDVTVRATGVVMTQVGHYADPDDLTSIPGRIIINSSFRTSEEGRAAFDAQTVATLGLSDRRFVDDDGSLNPSRAHGVLRGIETDDVLVEVQFPGSSHEDGAAVNYLITVRRTEQPAALVPRSTPEN